MTNRVRLTFAARCRFPDIATAIGTVTGFGSDTRIGHWQRVEWPGDRTTWLRAEDLEPVIEPEETP